MIEPTGAIRLQIAVVLASCQNAATLCGGGELTTEAGVLTDTEVSEYSRLGEFASPFHSTEQVTAAPCAAGGDQIEIWLTLTLPKKEVRVEFATVQIPPAANIKDVGVRLSRTLDALVKRYI